MIHQLNPKSPSHWLAITALLALVAAGGWVAGSRFSQPQAAQAAAGYDIGVAGKPRSTGNVREFQLVAREAPWKIAPGVTVLAITYNGQVPGPLIWESQTVRLSFVGGRQTTRFRLPDNNVRYRGSPGAVDL